MKLVGVSFQLLSGFIRLTHIMERDKAHFQMKTNLQDAWSEDIHNKVMPRSKNRNKAGYLRHCQTHTHLRLLGTHTSMMTHDLIARCICLPWVLCKSDRSERGHLSWHIVAFFTQKLLTFTLLTQSHHALCEQRRLLPGELLLWSSGGKPVEEGELRGMLAEPGPRNKTAIQVVWNSALF